MQSPAHIHANAPHVDMSTRADVQAASRGQSRRKRAQQFRESHRRARPAPQLRLQPPVADVQGSGTPAARSNSSSAADAPGSSGSEDAEEDDALELAVPVEPEFVPMTLLAISRTPSHPNAIAAQRRLSDKGAYYSLVEHAMDTAFWADPSYPGPCQLEPLETQRQVHLAGLRRAQSRTPE